MTRHPFLAAPLLVLLTLIATVPSIAQTTDPAASSIYRLEATSTYQHGCFAPCMCPIMETAGVRGTFRLRRTGSDGLYDYFAVTDVKWKVPVSTTIWVMGTGTYKVGRSSGQQQLSLDLKVDDRPVEHYDSGLVPGGHFPKIDIGISVHGRYCLDTAFDVHARPLMMLAVANAAVTWEPMTGATNYDVVGGDVGILRQSGGDFALATSACLANSTPGTSVSSGATPQPGRAFWFLAREIDGNVVETYDDGDAGQVGSRDAGVNASPASCP